MHNAGDLIDHPRRLVDEPPAFAAAFACGFSLEPELDEVPDTDSDAAKHR